VKRTTTLVQGDSGSAGNGQKEELVDVAIMNELKQLIGDPFDDGIFRDRR
jgi:hypothetical protein